MIPGIKQAMPFKPSKALQLTTNPLRGLCAAELSL
jgi:hypothetical protein